MGGLAGAACALPRLVLALQETAMLSTGKKVLGKSAYTKGQTVAFSAEAINPTASTITLQELHVSLKDISDPTATFRLSVPISSNLVIGPGARQLIEAKALWTVPDYALLHAFGINLGGTLADGSTLPDTFQTFFRVADPSILTGYSITSSDYKGLRVHELDGGMSAEYTVAKALENLTAGVAPSWTVTASGGGPRPVMATHDFLERSVRTTVETYNRELGAETPFDTVILSTGVASIPYLSRAMKAPVLPVQFLVSCDTVKEITTILESARDHGYQAYSTLGYDGSVAPAVAWIKLLALPQPYLDFLKQHRVKNLIIAGTTGKGAGEGTAKKVRYRKSTADGYSDGDLFLLYSGGGTSSDASQLARRLKDLGEYQAVIESDYRQISDWESGLVEEQIHRFATDAKQVASIAEIKLVTATPAGGTLALYNLATYLTLEFMKKNAGAMPPPTGIALNPYLLSHPFHESRSQLVPMLYWQGNPASGTVDRLLSTTGKAISSAYPGIDPRQLPVHVNASRNFGGYQAQELIKHLHERGFENVVSTDTSRDEVWNPDDGLLSICEKVATDLLSDASPAELKRWDAKLMPLAPTDLATLAGSYPEIVVRDY